MSEFTVLIVDDETLNRTLLTELLRGESRILLAKNAKQAFSLIQRRKPDLILLDILMPDMDGYEVIRILKEDSQTREIPVIFITSLDDPRDEEKGLALGAADYISKPFRPAIVQARVRNQLKLIHQRRLLEELARIDGLTEIPNRRHFTQVLTKEWRRCQRQQSPLSLAVVDVDHFKAYNDHYGHAAGDQVLRTIAQTLQKSLRRASDFVARYGGEEFVLLLPEMEAPAATQLAQSICQAVEALRIPHSRSPVSPWVTISIGGTTEIPPAVHQEPLRDFFDTADAYLYEAKRRGRNQVCWGKAH